LVLNLTKSKIDKTLCPRLFDIKKLASEMERSSNNPTCHCDPDLSGEAMTLNTLQWVGLPGEGVGDIIHPVK